MDLSTVDIQGVKYVELVNESLRLLITQSVGPRVLSLQVGDSENLFAELPNLTLACPGTGDFHFYGGHRLWYAPEHPARTYLPDDDPVDVGPIVHGVRMTQRPEIATNLQKEMMIRLAPGQSSVEVEHTITNHSEKGVTLAPWALTQLRPGGVAILPQFQGDIGGNPTSPNRAIALWPYTDVKSPHISWGDEYWLVYASMKTGKLKIGFPNPRGWIAYWNEGVLFIKHAIYTPDREYYDYGSSSECYCDPNFLELETLGPKETIDQGESVHHLETWEIKAGIDWSENITDLFGDLTH